MISLVWRTLIRSKSLVPPDFSRRSYGVVGLLLVQSILDVLGLGLIVSLVPLLLDRTRVAEFAAYQAVHRVMGQPSYEMIVVICLGFVLAIYVLKNLIAVAIAKVQGRYVFDVFQSLTTRLHRVYFDRGYLYLKKRNSTEVVRDISAVTGRFSENILVPLLLFLNETFVFFAIVVGILCYDPLAFLFVACMVLPPAVIFFHLVKNHISQLHERVNQLMANLQKSLFDSIFGFADVRITRTQDRFFKRYADLIREYCSCLRQNMVYNILPSRLLEVFFVLGIVSLGAYVALRIGDMAQATTFLAAYIIAAYRVLPSINRMTVALLSIKGHQYTLDTLEEARNEAVPQKRGEPKPLTFIKRIEFEEVSYRYPEVTGEILLSISFHVDKGECVGIVGPSGSGKTTLLNLLLGFLSPTSGSIRVDGVELTPEHLDSWYQLIGYVQQEVFLLEGFLRENIAFGASQEEVDIQRLNESIRLSSLEDLVQSLPNGVESKIGERGANLSVGQKQRIGIARALYSGAQLLIFDEATSALDPRTESDITDSIQKLSAEGYTIIIVAHRITTLRHTDRIIELEKGVLHTETTYTAKSALRERT